MKNAICKRCGHVHKKLIGDNGFSVLRALDKISECCPEPFYVWNMQVKEDDDEKG